VKRDTRYVTADDMLPVLDTVEEVLTFYAEFGLPLSMSKGEKDERVQNVMDLMALNHISRTFVGGQLGAGISVRGVSGGEKRRVSIGCVSLSLSTCPFHIAIAWLPGG
jgi:ATP-binding cassette subfamily G (WHITE) protein 2